VNDYGKTALTCALDDNHMECVFLLIPYEEKIETEVIEKICIKSIQYKSYNLFNYMIKHYNLSQFNTKIHNYLFSKENSLPYIKLGSFVDILNRAAKSSSNYEEAMEKIVEELEKMSTDKLKLYSRADNIETLLIDDFPKYKERIPRVIQDLKEESDTCSVCLNVDKNIYRNCVNCLCYVCIDCWNKLKKCPHCNLDTIKWKKCLNTIALDYLVVYDL